jgi:uncharacterized protein (TIGR02271 family)
LLLTREFIDASHEREINMISSNNVASLIGATVRSTDGEKIGTVGQIFVDPATGAPNWASVRTGLFGTSESFVPLEGASADDGDVTVAYAKDFVKDAPRIDADGSIEQDEEDALYSYYNNGGVIQTPAASETNPTYTNTTYPETTPEKTTGFDTSGPTTDDAMTRSEEQLHVGTETVETGRARLRKYIVTEEQTVTIPVSHEEVRLEREPITDANAGAALDGPDISEEEHEVILTEERPVIQKEPVPVERVRLETETVTDQQSVTEEVRKEQIEFDDDTRDGVSRP